MAITLTTTPCAANADSYADLAYATAYFARRTDGAQWAGTDDEKAAAMLDAMLPLESLNLIAERATDTQSLNFPRIATCPNERRQRRQYGAQSVSGFVDRRGRTFNSDVIPTPIKNAQCELALLFRLKTATNDADLTATRLSSWSTDGISMTYADGEIRSLWEQGVLPLSVKRLLAPFLRKQRTVKS